MGRLPAEVRAMTPAETELLVRAWNEANSGSDMPDAPTADEYEELVRQYG